MEMTNEFVYSDAELDIIEGNIIESRKQQSKEAIPDPDEWLDEEIKRNVLITTVD